MAVKIRNKTLLDIPRDLYRCILKKYHKGSFEENFQEFFTKVYNLDIPKNQGSIPIKEKYSIGIYNNPEPVISEKDLKIKEVCHLGFWPFPVKNWFTGKPIYLEIMAEKRIDDTHHQQKFIYDIGISLSLEGVYFMNKPEKEIVLEILNKINEMIDSEKYIKEEEI